MEHTSFEIQLIKEIKEGENFAAVRIDLANAYRWVPHKPIESAIELYHIPGNVQEIANSYFGGIQIRITIDDFTTSRHRVKKEIITTGCTISTYPLSCL